MIIIAIKRAKASPKAFGVPVISIGNIIVGGSGKTPMTIFLAQHQKNIAVVLRGYGRKSKGLYVISHEGKILEDLRTSGDEAMLLSYSLPLATIIVSEDRKAGILKAKELGCELVYLDDGFSKYDIQKFDILLRPKIEPSNPFCLPSGGYREPKMMYATAQMVLQEGKDFKRVITYKKDLDSISVLPQKLVLITAISKPHRLLEFLPEHVIMENFPDHYDFTQDDVSTIQNKYPDFSFITTSKDLVKLKQFDMRDLYLMDLEIKLDDNVDVSILDTYIKKYK